MTKNNKIKNTKIIKRAAFLESNSCTNQKKLFFKQLLIKLLNPKDNEIYKINFYPNQEKSIVCCSHIFFSQMRIFYYVKLQK
jgi:ribosomal protein L18E